ncbi:MULTISPECIES: hypothetical protein [unclassified Paenibacillus]|uniref:hypothetical protein n=1 Tax=unclassified Paenibacillus TaxID=185978 RepID=UPI0003901016|nr:MULTISPECIES: hypothetical protein [unclassified Paenibacillus]KKC47537.1 hypothetical protein VE23_10870 [Paenibacillus sp. D9]CDN46035.1 hypothetical protein BN871_KD_00020 [Paenibacillus sp. P22]
MKTRRIAAGLAACGLLGGAAFYSIGWAGEKALGLLADPSLAGIQEEAGASAGAVPPRSGAEPTDAGHQGIATGNSSAGPSGPSSAPEAQAESASAVGKASSGAPEDRGGGLSVEEARQAGKKLSLSEKAEALRILTGSLGSKEIAVLKELAKGGLSQDEKREVKELLLEQLAPGDYNRLSALAFKAGAGGGGKAEQVKR